MQKQISRPRRKPRGWTNAAPIYISLAVDRNAADSQFATRTATALVSRDQNLATAEKTRAIALADAIRDQSQTNTQSTFDLATNLALPARTYTRAIAQADRDHTVDVAGEIKWVKPLCLADRLW